MKIGVVGYGSIGQRHANNLRRLGHDVKVYDPIHGKGNDFKFERELYESDVEAVVIATPSPYHEGPLRACVERGKHVLIEKPISTSIGMLPQLLDDAAAKNLVVMTGNNLRFHPCVALAKQWLDVGQIGDPIWATFTCAQKNEKYRDSVVLNWGAHEVDLAIHFFGPVQKVLCAAIRPWRPGTADSVVNPMAPEDIADFVLLHDSGVRSSFHLDYLTTVEIRECWLAGTDHNIGIDFPTRRISLGKHVQGMGGTYDDDYEDEMKAFLGRIESRPVLGASGRDGLETLRVLIDVRKEAGVL